MSATGAWYDPAGYTLHSCFLVMRVICHGLMLAILASWQWPNRALHTAALPLSRSTCTALSPSPCVCVGGWGGASHLARIRRDLGCNFSKIGEGLSGSDGMLYGDQHPWCVWYNFSTFSTVVTPAVVSKISKLPYSGAVTQCEPYVLADSGKPFWAFSGTPFSGTPCTCGATATLRVLFGVSSLFPVGGHCHAHGLFPHVDA